MQKFNNRLSYTADPPVLACRFKSGRIRLVLLAMILSVTMSVVAFAPADTYADTGWTPVTNSGAAYTASGQTSVSNDGTYRFASTMTITFSGSPFASQFNRMNIHYSSTGPLEMKLTYTDGSQAITDTFYLEEGSYRVFSALNKSFLSGAKATKISKIVLTSLRDSSVDFRLYDVTVENVDLDLSDGIKYIENSRYKIGANLSCGGVLSYVEDKQSGVSGLGNLVNNHDTGRYIQQSYYGTIGNGNGYAPGTYNSTAWRYNPVQGGDEKGHRSRIIDVTVTGNSIYIKSQPMDWAKGDSNGGAGSPIKGYMENIYTLHNDRIQVDNRYLDFSEYTHEIADQELPAFIIISYLDTFNCYMGNSPWTDGALRTEAELPFWGDAANSAQCRFIFSQANTERWCAWNSSVSGFGFGIYTPDADVLFAGRYNYDGPKDKYKWLKYISPSTYESMVDQAYKDSSGEWTNYVAPIKQFSIVPFQPRMYSYQITTGTVSQIRATFKANRSATHSHLMRSVARKEPTCDKAGEAACHYCVFCDKLYSDQAGQNTISKPGAVAALGHKETTIPAVAATCTTAGKTAGKKCSTCNAILQAQQTIAALGHSYGAWTTTKAATCTTAGSEQRVCSRDSNHKETQAIPALGHTETTIPAVAATCTAAGKTAGKKCSTCNAILQAQQDVAALGHSYGAWTTTKAATCTTAGSEQRVCSRDGGHKETRAISAKGHTETIIPAVAATCWTPGTTEERKCSTCNTIMQAAQSIPAKGHTWDAGVVTRKPTVSSAGIMTYSCTSCSATRSESIDRLPSPTQRPTQVPTQAPGSNPAQVGSDGTAVGAGASATAAENAITSSSSDEGPAGSRFALLQLRSTRQSNNSIKLTWNRVGGAGKYVIYGNACGIQYKMKKLTITTDSSFNIRTAGKKLKKGTYYKFMVVALNGSNCVVSSSKVIHVATKGNKKKANPTKVTVKKLPKTLKVGRTYKLSGKQHGRNVSKHRGVAYETTNNRVATVSKKGVVRPVGKGTCYIYAYAQDGRSKKVKVTVK